MPISPPEPFIESGVQIFSTSRLNKPLNGSLTKFAEMNYDEFTPLVFNEVSIQIGRIRMYLSTNRGPVRRLQNYALRVS